MLVFLGNTFSTWTPSSLAKPGLSPSIPKIVKMTTPSSHPPLLHQETWRASRIRKFSGEKRDKNKTQQTHKDHPRHFERTTRVRWQRKNLRDVWLSCWKNGCKLFFSNKPQCHVGLTSEMEISWSIIVWQFENKKSCDISWGEGCFLRIMYEYPVDQRFQRMCRYF